MTTPRSQSFFSLVWRSYLRSALLPIILIELALVVAYLLTNAIIRDENIQTLQRLAKDQLQGVANLEAGRISDQLDSVAHMTRLLQRQTEVAYQTPYQASSEEQQRYSVTDGVLHTTRELPGRAALFYSNINTIGQTQRDKALQLGQLDNVMRDVVDAQPLVTQAYINTRDSMNRIYPYFDVIDQYPHDMKITEYNFFYDADIKHNPGKGPVWTDVYIDPAGQGWMTSCIAPVYLPGSDPAKGPEAVVGLDITLEQLIKQILHLDVPWQGYGILVDKSGTIMALPPQGEEAWGLKELTNQSYADAIRQDTFKPDEFNLHKRADTQALSQAMQKANSGITELNLNNDLMLVSWHTIRGTNWSLLLLVDDDNIYTDAMVLNARFNRIGYLMIGVLVLFYLCFFVYLYRKAFTLSQSVAMPLQALSATMKRIGEGDYYQNLEPFVVREAQETATGLIQMGKALGQYTQALEEAKTNLENLNQELEARVTTRTQELQDLNHQLNQENTAKAQLIDELRQTQAQLVQSEKMASIGQLAAGVAHEINNPMAYISANIEAMGDYVGDLLSLNQAYEHALLPSSDPARQSLDELKIQLDYDFLINDLQALVEESREGTRRVKKIIEDLREFSHGGDSDWAWTDVHKGLESTLNIAHNELKYKAEVVREYGNLPAVECIPSQINQVLLNLLINAAQAIEQFGRVTVRTGQKDDQVYIQVEDTGSGIDEKHLGQIFNPFFTTKPVGKGTGLGLAMSYNIMEKHHGRIDVTSVKGQGTCFTLWLPIKQPVSLEVDHRS
ncbi:ATP-binding protein [Pokkaliibacter plantistimulans]|uniref:ATP-binding protein n=1 Tax=Pokkaliibacter plantistimulans TaxID=1635171 RepID=UPI000D740C09|nr:ATP-binding protein [Pokkaliibacter plantistimulans]